MITYEFVFTDGTHLVGDGEDSAEALLDAYHRNGYLPNAKLTAKINISRAYPLQLETPEEPNSKKKARR